LSAEITKIINDSFKAYIYHKHCIELLAYIITTC